MDTIVKKLKPIDWEVFYKKQQDQSQVLQVVEEAQRVLFVVPSTYPTTLPSLSLHQSLPLTHTPSLPPSDTPSHPSAPPYHPRY